MSLLDFLKCINKNERLALASDLDTSIAQLNHIAYGARRANVLVAIRINRITDGAVELDSMRSDIDWLKLHADLTAALKLQATFEPMDLKEAA